MLININNDISEISTLCDKINKFCEENSISNKKRQDISLIVDELASNVIFYAYPSNERHSFSLAISISNDIVTIKIIDSGIPFNPLAKADPDTDLNAEERQIGGLGIFLVKQLAEAVTYRREKDQNHLTIIISLDIHDKN